MRQYFLSLLTTLALVGWLSSVSAQEMEDDGMSMDGGGMEADVATVNFEQQILPLLRESCFECHSDAKRKPKGNLRLDGKNWILVGGKTGTSVVAGNPGKSPLLGRSSLPDDHDDVMPPNGEVFETEQLQLIARWIKEGADFGDWTGKAGVELPNPTRNDASVATTDPFASYRRIGERLNAAPATAIAKATEAGARVSPVFPGSPLLRVEFASGSDSVTDASLKALAPLRRNIAILSLRNTAITDAAMAEIGRLANLVRLEIPGTEVTDAGLRTLAKTKLPELAILNLYGTAITDAGLDQLNYPKLAKVYLWNTKVTAPGADMLGKRLPNCRVIWKRELPAAKAREERGDGKRNRKKKKN